MSDFFICYKTQALNITKIAVRHHSENAVKKFLKNFAKNDKSGLLFTPAYSPIGVGIKFLTEQENKKNVSKKRKSQSLFGNKKSIQREILRLASRFYTARRSSR